MIIFQELMKCLRQFAAMCNDPVKDIKSVVIFLMSHGSNGCIYGTDMVPVKVVKIQEVFDGNNCPNLKEKPKLFFFQACRIGEWDMREGTVSFPTQSVTINPN